MTEDRQELPTEKEWRLTAGKMLQDEAVESVRRSLRFAVHSEEIGAKTLSALDEQGERLEAVAEDLEEAEERMEEAERAVQEMSQCCLVGCFRWMFRRRRPGAGRAAVPRPHPKRQLVDLRLRPTVVEEKGMGDTATPSHQKASVSRAFKAETEGDWSADDRDDELEECLSEVSDVVTNLKTISLAMGEELERQDELIGGVREKADRVGEKVRTAVHQAEKMM